MIFDRPAMLLFLWILPLVAGLIIYAQRKRAAAARRFVQTSMLTRLMPPLVGTRPWIKGTLVLLGLAAIITACARPRFGVYFENVVQREMLRPGNQLPPQIWRRTGGIAVRGGAAIPPGKTGRSPGRRRRS